MNVITDHHKTQMKRWVETAQVPELPLVAPRLPPGIINDAWPVFGRVYPRTVRWPLNGSRAIVWATWHLCRTVTRIPILGLVARIGWHLGAAVQAVLACIIALAATICIGTPLWILGATIRAGAWVVLVRRGWQPPLAIDHLAYLYQLDTDVETAVADEDEQTRLLIASPEERQQAALRAATQPAIDDTFTTAINDSNEPTRPELARVLVVLAAVVTLGAGIGHVTRNGLPQPPDWDAIHEQAEQ